MVLVPDGWKPGARPPREDMQLFIEWQQWSWARQREMYVNAGKVVPVEVEFNEYAAEKIRQLFVALEKRGGGKR